MASHLDRLLDPASIAVIGGTRAAVAIAQCERLGYGGQIWAVNPVRRDLGGHPTVATVGDLPGVPDAALVAVDRDRAVAVVAALRALGCGGAVCYASGFAESGPEGAARQRALLAAAGDMPLMGPNCHGFVNGLSGAALWPDVQGCRPVERGVAVVTQSGNLALNITMQQRGLALSHVITLGNQAGVRIEDCLEALIEDPRVSAVGLHVEALGDTLRFGRAALRAWDLGKPVVVLKTGVSDGGAAITRTHTASLAGPAAGYRALFERYRVTVVDSVPELLAVLAVAGAYGWLPGNRVVSLSCSGGEAALVADRAAGGPLDLPAFPAHVAARIDHALGGRVAVSNPLDYHTFVWGDGAALERCFVAALEAPVDIALLIVDFPGPGHDDTLWWPTLEAVVAAHHATGRRVVVTATLPENLPPRVCRALAEQGIPALHGIPEALAALAALTRRGTRPDLHLPASVAAPAPRWSRDGAGGATRRDPEPEGTATGDGAMPHGHRRIEAGAARARLAAAGLALPDGDVCAADDVVATAERVGYPVVVKAAGPDHRTEVGGVALRLADGTAVAAAVAGMAGLGDRFVVEAYVPDAVAELLVGIRREPGLGWTLTVGAGGVLVEVLDDTVTVLAPVATADLVAAIHRLRVGRVLAGLRGRGGGDLAAAADAIGRLVAAVVDDPAIVEVEVNPLLVLAHGVRAVDALILEAA